MDVQGGRGKGLARVVTSTGDNSRSSIFEKSRNPTIRARMSHARWDRPNGIVSRVFKPRCLEAASLRNASPRSSRHVGRTAAHSPSLVPFPLPFPVSWAMLKLPSPPRLSDNPPPVLLANKPPPRPFPFLLIPPAPPPPPLPGPDPPPAG
jgi:hypothetical protein